ncbi:hypothetical protein [Methanobrevibacter sp. V14]|uniref:hypothetical protein n=1 Tax=Methanobrevibacter sp. V14 TaxID=3064280 RepID=UPI002734C675|nr:hypothetical protein [Methanobrevibacter sp. V14]
MSKAASTETYRSLPDNRINEIVTFLSDIPYSEEQKTEDILPYIAQWLYNNYVNIESTCSIISEIINITPIEEKITNIYDGVTAPLPVKSHLQKYLTPHEFKELKTIIEPRKYTDIVEGKIDDSTNIITNFKFKQVLQEKISFKRNGETDSKFTPVIEAVPHELIIYDPLLLDQPRSFKIKWATHLSDKMFTTTGDGSGATINEISNYLMDAGYSHNPGLVPGAVSCMINSMIEAGLAEIKQDIDNPGVYYNVEDDKVTVVKKNVRVPSREEMARTAKSLHELSLYYKGHESTLATVLKWCLMAEFSYAMKQAGNDMEWLYLKGTSQSGKTTLARIGLFIHDEPNTEVNDIGGSSIDTVARLGAVVSKSCDPVIVNEPASVFNRKSIKEMIKLCVQSTTARARYSGGHYKGIPAFAPILFTANMYLPEDDAIINRMHVITFSYNQRKTDFEKKEFENKFHVKSPHLSHLKSLGFLGEYAIQYIVTSPGLLLDDWKSTADKIIGQFFFEMGSEVPEWLTTWEESETIGDLDDTQREDIRNFFVSEFNNARKKINVYDSYGDRSTQTLDVNAATTSDDFTNINWSIVNNRLLTWAIPFTSRNGTKYICLTQGLRKTLGDHLDFCADLKSIGELLGWNVKNTRFGKSKTMKVIKINFDEFMEFLYPNISLMEDGE